MCGEAYSDEDIQLLPVDLCVLSFQPEWAPGLAIMCVLCLCIVCIHVCVLLVYVLVFV